jgi:hypothetical protein
MFPLLRENSGLPFNDLIETLARLARERFKRDSRLAREVSARGSSAVNAPATPGGTTPLSPRAQT